MNAARRGLSRGGGEGFFEDGLEEVGGVGARVRHLQRQQPAAPQQRFLRATIAAGSANGGECQLRFIV